ncbi:endonuclease domain-containing protein [Streptomyces sp. SA3_actG]|nr:endonuclease domain-containing protein [Streptomyces sp. SA3_actG]SCD43437.1 Recombination endonuclease VII [Streptomyces sp. DfronAA-171]
MAADMEVRVVDGHIVISGTKKVPMLWLPREGEVVAKLPPRKGNRAWLHHTVGIRSPKFAGDRWTLPRSSLSRLLMAAIDRYGTVVLCRDMNRLSKCNRTCLEAVGTECQCSCLGLSHGQDSQHWYTSVGDAAVADFGEFKRAAVTYTPKGSDLNATLYNGELKDTLYRVDRASRRHWPQATRFMCAGCLTTPASVWDHCHTHGFVRAPLCNPCNTRHWHGWHPRHGRATANNNLDDSYYAWCPDHDRGTCSA